MKERVLRIPYPQESVYDHPLYYDIAFSWDITKEVDFLEAVFHRYGGGSTKRVIEFGCGTGRFLKELDRRGYEAFGIDKSAAMVEYAEARRRELGGSFEVQLGDMAQFKPPKIFDAALCTVSTLRYLTRDEQIKGHFRSVANAIRPGGLYVIDLMLSSPHRKKPVSGESWDMERDGIRVHTDVKGYFLDQKKRLEKLRLTFRVEDSDQRRVISSDEELRVFTRPEFERFACGRGYFDVAEYFQPKFDFGKRAKPGGRTGRFLAVLRRMDNEA